MLFRVLFAVFVIAASTVSAQPPQPQAKKIRYWRTNWTYPNIDVNDLTNRLKSIGIDVPIDAAGKVTVQFDVSVPLTRLRDGKAYRLEGYIASKRLRLQQLLLHDFRADVIYRDGVLELSNLSGHWSDADERTPSERGGSLSGRATAQLLPLGKLEGELTADSLAISPIYKLIVTSESRDGVSGRISGNLGLSVPIQQLRDIESWKVKADVQATEVRIGSSDTVTIQTGPVILADGKITATGARIFAADSADACIAASANINLKNRQSFEFMLGADDIELAALSKSLLGNRIVGGKLDLQAQVRGELASGKFTAAGRIGSPRLDVTGVDLGLIEHEFSLNETTFSLSPVDPLATQSQPDVQVRSVQMEYRVSPESLHIDAITASLFGGSVTGTAQFARADNGRHQLHLVWRDIRPRMSSASLPLAQRFSAISSGQLDVSCPAESLESAAGTLLLGLDEISFSQSNVGRLNLRVELTEHDVRAEGTGELWGGKAGLNIESARDIHSPAINGQVTITSLKLNEAARFLPPRLQRLTGQASAVIDIQPAKEDAALPTADIQVSATDVRLDRRSLSRRLNLRASARGSKVQIESINGSFAGGQVRAEGRWSFTGGVQQLQVSASDIDASAALWPLLPAQADWIDGKVSGSATITGGQRLHARGSLSARRSSLFGVPTGTIISSFSASVSSNLSRWELRLPSIRGQLAGGRIGGEVKLASSTIRSGSPDLTSRWDLRNVDFGQVLGDVSGSSPSFAHGRMTGEISLGGRGIRGIGDLNGRFQASLGDTQSSAVPGLVAADRFLGVISLAQVRFDKGELRGVIGGGAARLEEFWLRSSRVKVWADGKIQLASGGCDLGVVISTGNFDFDNAKIVPFATQLAIQSVVPIAGLVEINRLLSNRTVHLAFTGPVTDPRIRLKPLDIIRDEAARFLMREILVAASVSSGSR